SFSFFCSAQELILSHSGLSKFGERGSDEIQRLARLCRERGIRTLLEWDILMDEKALQRSCEVLKELDLTFFDAIRVQDPGTIQILKENYPHKKIQLILENGHHNLAAIEQWCNYLGKQLDRIVLSIELPHEVIWE